MVQLRQENLRAESFNLVGFQNHMRFGDQARVLRMIPGLQNAEFLRFGQIHRNTYINAPALLDSHPATAHAPRNLLRRPDFRRRRLRRIHRHRPHGRHARRRPRPRRDPAPLPRATALGSLCHYVSAADPKDYQPANITFDLLPQLDEATRQRLRRDKKARHAARLPPGARKPSTSISMPASELERQIALYLEDLARAGNSAHSIRAYEADLRQFLAYLSPPELAPPEPTAIDLLLLREWLASLYGEQLAAVTMRRKLAAVRGLFRFMLREGVVPLNVARLVRTPKAPQKLPEVMTAEQVNTLLDGVAAGKLERPFPARDRAIFELLYGCGIRVSELAGLNLEDLDRSERWLRVRGKGKKERQVPLPGKAADVAGALPRRTPRRARGTRRLPQSPQVAPHHARHQRHRQTLRHAISPATRRCTRTASATPTPPTCSPMAPTCAPSRNSSATPASPPPRNIPRYRSRTSWQSTIRRIPKHDRRLPRLPN